MVLRVWPKQVYFRGGKIARAVVERRGKDGQGGDGGEDGQSRSSLV